MDRNSIVVHLVIRLVLTFVAGALWVSVTDGAFTAGRWIEFSAYLFVVVIAFFILQLLIFGVPG